MIRPRHIALGASLAAAGIIWAAVVFGQGQPYPSSGGCTEVTGTGGCVGQNGPTFTGFVASSGPAYVNLNAVPGPALDTGTVILAQQADATASIIENNSFGSTPSVIERRADGTGASPSAVLLGDVLANFASRAFDGSIYPTTSTGNVQMLALENFTTAHHGTGIGVSCTAITTTTTAQCGEFTATGLTLPTGETYQINGVQISSGNLSNSAAIALSSNNLSFFAATTSAQLAGVISDETGTGALVFGTSPALNSAGTGYAAQINRSAVAMGGIFTGSNNVGQIGFSGNSVQFGVVAGTGNPAGANISILINGTAPSGGAIGDVTPGANDNAINLGVATERWKAVYGTSLITTTEVKTGSTPALTGTCTTASQTGGNTAGSFTATCTAGTVIITFAATAPNGWICSAEDQSTPTDTLSQTANGIGSCTLTGTTVASDRIVFNATAF